MTDLSRRATMGLGLAAGAATLALARVRAQTPSEVKIAMLVPLSGPWARQGILEQMGARMAIDDINNAGGIKSMGGAKLKLVEYDTQDSAEKAKDAAQRMLAQEPDLVGGFGCWLSTFTLAATEVTERAELPWLTLSVFRPDHRPRLQACVPVLADRRSAGRGSAADDHGAGAERHPARSRPRSPIIGDNTASSVSFMKPIRDPRGEGPGPDARCG